MEYLQKLTDLMEKVTRTDGIDGNSSLQLTELMEIVSQSYGIDGNSF